MNLCSKKVFPNGERGFSLVEVLVATAIVAIALTSLITAVAYSLKADRLDLRRLQSSYLAEEELETVRLLRDQSWETSFGSWTDSAAYYIQFNPSTGSLSATEAVQASIDGIFTPSFTVSDVDRDVDGNIAASGVNDPNTKLVTVSVGYPDTLNPTTLSAYFTNIFSN